MNEGKITTKNEKEKCQLKKDQGKEKKEKIKTEESEKSEESRERKRKGRIK